MFLVFGNELIEVPPVIDALFKITDESWRQAYQLDPQTLELIGDQIVLER